MNIKLTLIAAAFILCTSCVSKPKSIQIRDVVGARADSIVRFEVVSWSDSAVLRKSMPGTLDNGFGVEGGTVLLLNDTFHLFTTEMYDTLSQRYSWKTRFGHWTSRDGNHWQRVSTIYRGDDDFTGVSIRSATWSPMPVWDEEANVWNLFYVTYRSKPNTADAWYLNYDGRVWRAVSQIKGRKGIGGPYQDVGVVLRSDSTSGTWEGLQGTDSFFPYKAGNRWYAFFGSAQTQFIPCKFWGVGLATASTLAGPWNRVNELNPTDLGSTFAENPVVTVLANKLYIAMIDGGPHETFGYTVSVDGVHWTKASFIQLPARMPHWWSYMRTPLCLIPKADGTYTTFFTAQTSGGWASMGRVTFKLTTRIATPHFYDFTHKKGLDP